MNRRDTMSEYTTLTEKARIAHELQNPNTARLVVSNNTVLASKTIPGLHVIAEETEDGISSVIRVDAGTVIKNPVHLCFGVLDRSFSQHIDLDIAVEKNAAIEIVGHCVFPNATEVTHTMDGRIELKENARYAYREKHIHSDDGGVKVYPQAEIVVGERAVFATEFELLQGRVGLIDVDYRAVGERESSISMLSRVSGHSDDIIKIKENAELRGIRARAVLRSRVAVRDTAKAEVFNLIKATAAYARGHVDCTEILQGNGMVQSYPNVEVRHPKARVTHEANLGGVDNRQLETLMARGLTEKDAEELIIRALLS
jgi:hypothetical protein